MVLLSNSFCLLYVTCLASNHHRSNAISYVALMSSAMLLSVLHTCEQWLLLFMKSKEENEEKDLFVVLF